MAFPLHRVARSADASEQRGWRYRRSLASRVTLLTTLVVGLSIAAVALAAFLTVRMQMQSSLDESMLNRAHKAAEGGAEHP